VFGEQAIDAGLADAEPTGNRCWAKLLLAAQAQHFDGIDRRLAALVDAAHLGGAGPFELAPAPQVRLEPGEHAEHVASAQ
jgi:hypothetical protein